MQLDKITGKVWLTKNVKLKPNQSLKVKARSSNTMTQIKVNRLMVTLFTCDCGNCVETV